MYNRHIRQCLVYDYGTKHIHSVHINFTQKCKYCICFINKSFLTDYFFRLHLLLLTIFRPCHATCFQSHQSLVRSAVGRYGHMQVSGGCHWCPGRCHCSHWSFKSIVLPINYDECITVTHPQLCNFPSKRVLEPKCFHNNIAAFKLLIYIVRYWVSRVDDDCLFIFFQEKKIVSRVHCIILYGIF